jgi:hypothetical protein
VKGIFLGLFALWLFYVFLYVFRMDLASLSVHRLPTPNPTSYAFKVPLGEAKKKISEGFHPRTQLTSPFYRSLGLRGGGNSYLSFKLETAESAVFSRKIFEQHGDMIDFHLHTYGTAIKSRTYFALGESLPYVATFAVSVKTEGQHTLVSIITIDPNVLKGFGGIGLHGTYEARVPVEPTTIEEYSLLLYIGNLLGVTDMPALRLPK